MQSPKNCSYSPQNRVRNGKCCSIWIIFIKYSCIFEKPVLSLHQQPTQRRCTFFQRLSARLAPALVPFLELVRARIRNTRGIENGILLNRDTNTIEALAALHIPSPHMMHTESRQARHGAETVDVGNHAAPVTIRRKRHGRDRDPNNPSVARVWLYERAAVPEYGLLR